MLSTGSGILDMPSGQVSDLMKADAAHGNILTDSESAELDELQAQLAAKLAPLQKAAQRLAKFGQRAAKTGDAFRRTLLRTDWARLQRLRARTTPQQVNYTRQTAPLWLYWPDDVVENLLADFTKDTTWPTSGDALDRPPPTLTLTGLTASLCAAPSAPPARGYCDAVAA